MLMRSLLRRALELALVAGLTVVPALAGGQDARADGPVSPTGKGIAGTAMIGAEVVMIGIGIGGVNSTWPYLVFGAVGAGGGAVGGYFLETEVEDAEPSLYMLAGGMALIVPTLVVVLNATAYDPSSDLEDGEKDISPDDEMPGADPSPAAKRRKPLPMALVGLDEDGPRLGLPAVSVGPRFSQIEQMTYGVDAGTEVRLPLVSGSF